MKRKIKTTEWDRTFRDLPAVVEVNDDLAETINVMNLYIKEQNYERAREAKEMIVEELEKPRPDLHAGFDLGRENCNTLMAVHDKLREHNIRLDWTKMELSKYLLLLKFVHNEMLDVKAKSPARLREATAKGMVLLGVQPQKGRGRGAPNRAFMDVLYGVDKKFAVDDLLRRTRTKLWHAMKNGRGLEEVRKEFKELNDEKRKLNLETD